MQQTSKKILLIITILFVVFVAPNNMIVTAKPLDTNPGITNLVAWWTLDETSGTRYDSIGTNHLTDNNTVGYIAGKQGNAASFVSANSEWLSVADNAALSGAGGNLYIAAWVRTSSLSGYQTIIGKNVEYEFDFTPSSLALYKAPSGGSLSYGSALSGNTWYFVEGYVSSSGLMGISVNRSNDTTLSTGQALTDTVYPFGIGALFYSGSAVQFLSGAVDEVAVYKRILSTAERDFLYNSGNGRTFCELTTCATATPTNTATIIPTNTATSANTATFTPTNTATFTPSKTPTVTNTVPGPTNTATDTPTHTATFTPSDTPTATLTPTITFTPTITNTPLPTRTPGNIATAVWDGLITYGDAANVTVTALLCLVVVLGLMAYIITSNLQRTRK